MQRNVPSCCHKSNWMASRDLAGPPCGAHSCKHLLRGCSTWQSRYRNKPLSLSQCVHDVQLNGAKGGKDASKKTHQHRKDDALQENSRAEAK